MDDNLVEINGADVHRSYVAVSIVYTVMVAALWPFIIVGCRRAYLKYKSTRAMTQPIYWAHFAAIAILLAVVAIDPVSIFFDVSGTVNVVCLLEGTLLLQSTIIVSFVESLQHYMVQQTLTQPPWIDSFKKRFVWFNLGVGNIMVITQLAIDRVFISGLTLIFLAIEGAVIGPVFCVVVRRLTKRLVDQFASSSSVASTNSEGRQAILKGVRKFRLFAYLSTFFMYFLVLIVAAVYVPRFLGDPTLIYSNDANFPDFARHRRFKGTFKLNWIMWVMLNTTCWLTWRHWIKKSTLGKKSFSPGKACTTNSGASTGGTFTDTTMSANKRDSQLSAASPPRGAETPTNTIIAQDV